MSLQPRRPLLDALRDVLRKMEADTEPETPKAADLKRIIRQRISEIETAQKLTSGQSSSPRAARI